MLVSRVGNTWAVMSSDSINRCTYVRDWKMVQAGADKYSDRVND